MLDVEHQGATYEFRSAFSSADLWFYGLRLAWRGESKGFPVAQENQHLRFGPIGPRAVHVCVDMQRLFAEETPWKTPWMPRVLPRVVELVAHKPARTIFTRFIPAAHPGQGDGVWRRYWSTWADITLERLAPGMTDLIPELALYAPPARFIDKTLYSPWVDSKLEAELRARSVDTLIVSGGETDVCVLGTVLGGVDRGYRIILVTDALCSSSDEAHDAMIKVYHQRYNQQVETVPTALVLEHWRD